MSTASGADPLVSVIMSAYNAGRYLRQAIESILCQTYRPFEIVAVDDGSTDNSSQILRSYKEVKYIYKQNEGDGIAKNWGVEASSGDYIAFLDADDIWVPDKLKLQMDCLLNNADVGLVVGKQKYFLDPGAVFPPFIPKELRYEPHVFYGPSALLVRRDVFLAVGFLKPEFSKTASDLDWFFRARDAGIRMEIIDRILLYRRVHGGNVSHVRAEESRRRRMEIIKASIDRKKQSGES